MKWAGAAIAVCTVLLMAMGLVTLASIGDVQSSRHFHDPNHFLAQQAAFDIVALCIIVFFICFPPTFWFRPGMIVAISAAVAFGLVATHVPGLQYRALGATRWIRIGGYLLQPSEFIKIAAVLLLSWWLDRVGAGIRRFRTGLLPAALGIGAILAGFFLQDDLGSCVMLLAVNGILLFIGGARIRHLILFAAIAAVCGGVWIANSDVRRARITSVLFRHAEEPQTDLSGLSGEALEEAEREAAEKRAKASDRTYQVRMAASAFAAGGMFGRGLGNSLFKRHYLPENHTDFILAMVGEEMGLVASGGCLLLFAVFFVCGMIVAWRAPDAKRRWMAAGLTLHICLSGAVNVGVVTGALPTKGLALPFLSYGGSSIFGSALAAGLLLAIAFRPGRPPAPPPPPRRDTGETLDFWPE